MEHWGILQWDDGVLGDSSGWSWSGPSGGFSSVCPFEAYGDGDNVSVGAIVSAKLGTYFWSQFQMP